MNFKLALLAAAVVGAASTAQAADLAKKAPAAANYVKVCDAYGAGFFYIPGSETCLKISGYVRAQYNIYSHDRDWSSAYGWTTRDQHGISTLARGDIQIDARTTTEMGLLRSFIEFETNVASTSSGTGGVTLDKAFVQFGGLTAGRATSFFDFWTGYTYGAFEPAHSDSNINLLGYTFSFGNGITASIAIEDPSTGSGRARNGAYGGVKYPDLVANVNITQAWGAAQLMGALHQNYPLAAISDKWGWAIGAGVTVNLPMLGAGDALTIQGAYSKGAIDYAAAGYSGLWAKDFYVGTGNSIEQTTVWSIAAGLTHNWTKTLSSSLEGSYLKYDEANADRDYSQFDIGGNLVWAPVTGLSIGAELEYRKVDYTSASTTASIKDAGAFIGILRIQRSF